MNWRRILLLSIALVSVLGITTWALLQNSDVATEFVRRQLNQAFATRVGIAATTINLEAGRLQITDFQLADPTKPQRNLAQVATANIDVQADILGKGIQLRHVSLDGLDLEIGPKWPTLDALFNRPSTSSPSGPLDDAPVVEVRSGTAKVTLTATEAPLVCDKIQVTLAPLAADTSKLQLSGEISLAEPAHSIDHK